MMLLKFLPISLIILLIGCNPSIVKSDAKMLRAYQASCDKVIADESYDIVCDRYLALSDNPEFITDPNVVKIRKKYIVHREAYKQRREESMKAERAARKTKLDKQYAPATLSQLSDTFLCLRYWSNRGDENHSDAISYDKNLTAELIKRGFTSEQLKDARKGYISIGDSKCMIYAAMGLPSDENRTVTKYTVKIQHVYRKNGVYIYSTNGVITSWQD